jgi:hypothetical protein
MLNAMRAVTEAIAIVAKLAGEMEIFVKVAKIKHGVPISTTSGVREAESQTRPYFAHKKPKPAVAKTGITAARIGSYIQLMLSLEGRLAGTFEQKSVDNAEQRGFGMFWRKSRAHRSSVPLFTPAVMSKSLPMMVL